MNLKLNPQMFIAYLLHMMDQTETCTPRPYHKTQETYSALQWYLSHAYGREISFIETGDTEMRNMIWLED